MNPRLFLQVFACLSLMLLHIGAGATTLTQARQHLVDGDYAQAAEIAREILQKDFANEESQSNGQSDGQDGNQRDTQRDAQMILGYASEAVGDIDAAIGVFEAAIGKPLDTIVYGDLDIRLDAAFEAARLRHTFIDPVAALDQLYVVQSTYEDRNTAGTPSTYAETIAVGKALHLLSKADAGNTNTALDVMETAIAMRPDNPEGHIAIGHLLLDRYNNAEAASAFGDALALDPLNASALLGRARSQQFDNSSSTADTLQQVLELKPNSVTALVMLARQHIEIEDYRAAQLAIDKALSTNPRSLDAITLKAAVLFLSGETAEFDKLVQRTRRQAPGYSQLFETLAEIAAQSRRYRDAASFALFAINFYEYSWRGHALLGINRLRLGHMQHGRTHLENAFSGDPYDVWTKNTLDLLDHMDTFSVVRSQRFELVAPENEANIIAPWLLPIAERAFDVFEKKYRHKISTPIRIELYDRHEDLSVRTVGLVGVGISGLSFGPVIALDSPSAGLMKHFNWAAVLWHELAHSFQLSLSKQRIPRWFAEGLAVFEEHQGSPGWGNDVSVDFLTAFKEGKLHTASDLNLSFVRPQYPNHVLHAYFQSYLLVEMIDRDHGFDAIADMVRGYGSGQTTNDMMTQLYGMSTSQFDTHFNDYIANKYQTPLNALFGSEPPQSDKPLAVDSGEYQEQLAKGAQALKRGDIDDAIATLTDAQTLFPGHAGRNSSYHLLAEALESQGDVQGAIVQLERNVAIDADDFEALRKLSELYSQVQSVDDTIDSLERAVLVEPFDQSVHTELAEYLGKRQRWSEAVRSRQAIVDLNPNDPVEAHYQLALVLSNAGDTIGAKTQLLKALEDAPMYDEALELLLQIREQK